MCGFLIVKSNNFTKESKKSFLKSLNFLLPDLESRIRKIQSYELYPINDKDIFDENTNYWLPVDI